MRCFFLALEVFKFSCWFWLLLLLLLFVVVVVPKASPSFQTSTYLPCSHMAKGGSGNLKPADRSLSALLPFEGAPTGVVVELLSLKVCMAVDVTAIGVSSAPRRPEPGVSYRTHQLGALTIASLLQRKAIHRRELSSF